MVEKTQVRILGESKEIPICRDDPDTCHPYLHALEIYKNLIKDVKHLKNYCLQRKVLLETDILISTSDVYEGLFQLGISPGQERLYSLGVLYYLLECPKQWGKRLGDDGQVYFCYQGSLGKVENLYEEYEKKQEQVRKLEAERLKKKREEKKKENQMQPVNFFTKKKKKKRRKKKSKKKIALIKVLPQQGQFTLFLKHPCYLYLKEWINRISNEENLEISDYLKEFIKDKDMTSFSNWYEERLVKEEVITKQLNKAAVIDPKKKKQKNNSDSNNLLIGINFNWKNAIFRNNF